MWRVKCNSLDSDTSFVYPRQSFVGSAASALRVVTRVVFFFFFRQ